MPFLVDWDKPTVSPFTWLHQWCVVDVSEDKDARAQWLCNDS